MLEMGTYHKMGIADITFPNWHSKPFRNKPKYELLSKTDHEFLIHMKSYEPIDRVSTKKVESHCPQQVRI